MSDRELADRCDRAMRELRRNVEEHIHNVERMVTDRYASATPNLELLYRFAKVAGWRLWEGSGGAMGHLGDGLVVSLPGRTAAGGMSKLYERDASDWIDSDEALDAAAIVIARRGRSWIEDTDISTGDRRRIRILTSHGEAVGDWTKPRSRAAVIACLAAFEEKL